MFMVLVLHADFQALGAPNHHDIINSPVSSFVKILLEIVSIGAVNIFVLISGWFGIHPSIKGFCSFAFQCLFFSIGIYGLLFTIGQVNLSMLGIASCFSFPGSYWFIPSYICLYIFSPILNTFINTADKKTHIIVIASFFIFQFLYSFCTNSAPFLMKGYSTLSFMGLYLLASYARRYSLLKKWKNYHLIALWLIIIFLMTFFYISICLTGYGRITDNLLDYSNPLVIGSALILVLFCSRLRFSNRLINKIAASCFAVYLLHCNPYTYYNYYLESVRSICNNNNLVVDGLLVFCIICIWFVASVLLDQVRIWIWNLVNITQDIFRDWENTGHAVTRNQ